MDAASSRSAPPMLVRRPSPHHTAAPDTRRKASRLLPSRRHHLCLVVLVATCCCPSTHSLVLDSSSRSGSPPAAFLSSATPLARLRERSSRGATTLSALQSPVTPVPVGDSDNRIFRLRSGDELEDFLQEHNNKVVVLCVQAKWCHSCAKQDVLFKEVADQYTQGGSDEEDGSADKQAKPALFAVMDFDDNREYVQKELGVRALPYVQMYAGAAGRVEEFPCGPSKIPELKAKLDLYTGRKKENPSAIALFPKWLNKA
ncbi:unnamed protein product [Vitrella brassicaformis CCMP3155]|uniref:Thioredoxin domain-containing protein n=2 Tax=Vitrella brassicaformis TaxID=1169539 RepID=A0A0G4GM03_VITBC|nr:unnamed protein product [Vitrella brassicaformis CCMP3155]|eukprot:CEM31090.1 unnamed protein product [Vitrella brassicaformis CCMP3155]